MVYVYGVRYHFTLKKPNLISRAKYSLNATLVDQNYNTHVQIFTLG